MNNAKEGRRVYVAFDQGVSGTGYQKILQDLRLFDGVVNVKGNGVYAEVEFSDSFAKSCTGKADATVVEMANKLGNKGVKSVGWSHPTQG